MIPQLWTRNLEWLEWRQMHPDLNDREAEYLYQVEQKMFQNYQDEIRNQTLNRQSRLTGDLLNLSADISTTLNEGLLVTPPPRRYVLLRGVYGGRGTGVAVNRGVDDRGLNILKGDEFVFDFIGSNYDESDSGTYRALVDLVGLLTGLSDNLLNIQIIMFLNELSLKTGTPAQLNTARFEKISDSTTINTNVDYVY